MTIDTNDPITIFITWTMYGSWLPGDFRGWTKWHQGQQPARPLLENWCRDRMQEKPVVLNHGHREKVESVIRQHAHHRGWDLHAVSVRSNHVHVLLTAVPKSVNREFRDYDGVKTIRDQLKANSARVLRNSDNPITNKKVWTKGGDIQFVDSNDIERVTVYVTEAQDLMGRGK